MIGAYVPQLLNSGLLIRMALLTAAAIALVTYLRQRHGTFVAIVFVLGGSNVAVLPGIVQSLSGDLAGWGDACRERNQVDLPDWFFALYLYFDIGLGTLMSLLGMVCGSVALVAGGCLVRPSSHTDSQNRNSGLGTSGTRLS